MKSLIILFIWLSALNAFEIGQEQRQLRKFMKRKVSFKERQNIVMAVTIILPEFLQFNSRIGEPRGSKPWIEFR